MGSRSATSDWSNYFSLTWFASNLSLAQRRGVSVTQRVKERHRVPVRTTCGKPRRVRINRLHPHLPSSSGGNFLCSVHFNALSPARFADIVRLFAKLFHRTMGISGAESLSSAANIFVGIESTVVIRPYLEKMTRSELLLVLTAGMATVASSTLGVYVAFLNDVFPQIAGHLISASILSIPACVVVAKLLIPETDVPETLAAVPPEDESSRSKNLMSAIIQGAMDGLKLAAGITALLIAILGLVALVDKLLGAGSSWLGMSEPLSFVRILSWVFLSLRISPRNTNERCAHCGSPVG